MFYVDRASALSSASIWWALGSLGSPGCLRRDVLVQGGNVTGKRGNVEINNSPQAGIEPGYLFSSFNRVLDIKFGGLQFNSCLG